MIARWLGGMVERVLGPQCRHGHLAVLEVDACADEDA
jgi:hypothetical protein